MSKKFWTVILGFICVVGVAASVFVFTRKDKVGPEIFIDGNDAVYYEGVEPEDLIRGVTAVDEVDGDVSDSIMVEAVYPSKEDQTAKVIYAALDRSNNVSKQQWTIPWGTEEDAKSKETEKQTEQQIEKQTKAVMGETEEETTEESEEESPLADVTLMVVNATNTQGIAAAWQERLETDGYKEVKVGTYGEVLQVSAICSPDEELIEVLKEYFPNALVENKLPIGRVDVSLDGVDVCVIVGEQDEEVAEMPKTE